MRHPEYEVIVQPVVNKYCFEVHEGLYAEYPPPKVMVEDEEQIKAGVGELVLGYYRKRDNTLHLLLRTGYDGLGISRFVIAHEIQHWSDYQTGGDRDIQHFLDYGEEDKALREYNKLEWWANYHAYKTEHLIALPWPSR